MTFNLKDTPVAGRFGMVDVVCLARTSTTLFGHEEVSSMWKVGTIQNNINIEDIHGSNPGLGHNVFLYFTKTKCLFEYCKVQS